MTCLRHGAWIVLLALCGCTADEPASDDEAGEADETDETDDETDVGGPLYLLSAGQGRVWVSDLSEPGEVAAAAEIIAAGTETFTTIYPSPDARWAAIVTTGNANANLSVRVWLHDFVAAPLAPATALPLDPNAHTAMVWWAPDGSALAVETRGASEPTLVHVEIGEGGPAEPLEVPGMPGYLYDAAYTHDGSRLIARISSAKGLELHVSGIVEGQPQALVRLPEFEGELVNSRWQVVDDVVFYDTLLLAGEGEPATGSLHRRELAAWPEHVVQTKGPQLGWNGASWCLSDDGSRLVVAHEDGQSLAVADADSPDEVQVLPGAAQCLGLSDDGRFGFMAGGSIADLTHELLVFDFEAADPLEGHALGLFRGSANDLRVGASWWAWRDGSCRLSALDPTTGLDASGPLDSSPDSLGFVFARETDRLYARGFADPLDDVHVIHYRDLATPASPLRTFAHPFADEEQLFDLIASPFGDRHIYSVVDASFAQGVLWERSIETDAAVLLGQLEGQRIESLWAPGVRVATPLQFSSGCP